MKHLRYDNLGVDLNNYKHPQDFMKELGITYQHATPQSMIDQWWFWNCQNIPDELPSFIEELKADPMKCIGNGLSEEDAKSIAQNKKEE